MIFSFLKRRRADAIEPLYGAVMAAALNPVLFQRFGVPDTFEGRFEAVTLHAGLVLRRLGALPRPADDLAQDLVDRIFDGFDSAMRSKGISDNGLPRRMKKFAQAFYGRIAAYSEALAQNAAPDALAAALSRNLLEGAEAQSGLVDHIRSIVATLETCSFDDLVNGRLTSAAQPAEHTP